MNAKKLQAFLPHVLALIIFLIVNGSFFAPQFQGKVLQQTDIINYKASSKEARDYKEANGKALLWTDAMFGGMPTYQITGTGIKTVLGSSYAEKVLRFFIKAPFGYIFSMMLGYYILMLCIRVNPWIAIAASVAYAFATYNFALLEAGHSNKIRSLTYLPIIMAGLLYLVRDKKYLLGGAIFTFGLAGNLGSNHIQMTYYFLITIIVLGLIYLVDYIRHKAYQDLMKAVGVALVGMVLASASVLFIVWPSYEYGDETMRGSPILETQGALDPSDNSATDGLAWDYAMEWSNANRDLLSILAPRAVGGSSGEAITGGPLFDLYRQNGVAPQNGEIRVNNLYWGALLFTSGPTYFGVVVLFLFVLGLILVKGPFKWWLAISVALTLLLSLGKNFEVLQRFFFDYIPVYNKFRAPSSIVAITAVFLPVLGGLVLHNILENKYETKEALRALYIATGICGGLTLIFALMGTSLFSFAHPGDAQYQDQVRNIIVESRQDVFVSDMWRSFRFVFLSALLIWLYINNYIKQSLIVVAGISLLSIFDLYQVGRRYINPASFQQKNRVDQVFTPRPVDNQILSLEKSRGDYRVFDLSPQQPFSSAMGANFHNQIGGYSAAKLQRYDDLIKRHIGNGNQAVLNMLNTKYVISREQQLQTNPAALGNAWMVEEIRKVNTPNEEIDALGNFDPANTAIVLDQEFNNYIGAFDPQKNGTISLSKYDPQDMEYQFNSSSEQLVVFSEIWYSPSKGWKAFIDDQEVPFIRANYALRALRVPAGQHKINFKFEPRSVKIGGTISMLSAFLILLAFLGIVGWYVYQYFDKYEAPMKKAPKEVATKAKKRTNKKAKVKTKAKSPKTNSKKNKK